MGVHHVDDQAGFCETRERGVRGGAGDDAEAGARASSDERDAQSPADPGRNDGLESRTARRHQQDCAGARDWPRRHPGERPVSDRRADPDGARSENAGSLQTRGSRERDPDLLARHRQPRQGTLADAYEPGLRHTPRRSRGDRAQPRHQQHPVAHSRRQPHRYGQPGPGRHLRHDDEGSGALRRTLRRGRRPGRLDLGRGQYQAARCDWVGLRRRLLRCPQHRARA